MALLDLLRDPTAFATVNPNDPKASFAKGPGGPSKGITYIPNTVSFQFNQRVSWDVNNVNADPTFLVGTDNSGFSINSFGRVDPGTGADRRFVDVQRLTNFLYNSPQGSRFLLRQSTLQLLNPTKNQRVFNGGANLLAQIAASGLNNIKREGPTPFSKNDGYIDYFITPEDFKGGFLRSKKNIKGVYPRERTYGLGDPGSDTSSDIIEKLVGTNPFKKPVQYNLSYKDSINRIDKVNALQILDATSGVPDTLDGQNFSKDFCPFRFEVINHRNPIKSKMIVFRAYLDNIDDNFKASHTAFKYNGRPESFYIYDSFNRSISVSFKIAAQTRHEMQPLYKKLNYLAAQTAPQYNNTSGRIMTPYMRLTVGDWMQRIPGILESVRLSWSKDYPWEIKSDENDKDSDMAILPHLLDVAISFTPIHDFIPSNNEETSYIGHKSFSPSVRAQNFGLAAYYDKSNEEITQEEFYQKND